MKTLILMVLVGAAIAYGGYEQARELMRLGRMAREVAQTQGEES